MLTLFNLPQYKMVLVNIISVSFLVIGMLFYRYIFPKKKISFFVLLLIISLLPLISIFRAGSYQSGDLSLHAKYAMPFYENIVQGNIIPQWSGEDCSHYGCPEYMFIFFLPYYIVAGFHFLGLSFIASIKVLLIVTYLLSGIGMYLWIKEEFGEVPGFVSAILYLYAPYHLIDMHFRVSIGEVTCYAILPFAFLFVKKLVESKRVLYLLLLPILLAFLILSHQPTALFSFPILFFYGIILLLRKPKKKLFGLLRLAGAFLVSILLSTFYWLPLLVERNYITYSVNQSMLFFPITQYLYAPVRLGLLFQGHKGELYPIVGYVQLFIIVFSFILLFKNKIKGVNKILLIFFLSITIVLFLIMQSFTQQIWNIFSFIKNIQFAYRMMLEISFATAVIAGIVVKTIPNRKFIITLCIIAILSTILNWGNRQNEPTVTDTVLQTQQIFPEKRGFVEVSTPVWVNKYAPWIGKSPKEPMQILSGKAQIVPIKHLQTQHIYQITVQRNAILKENTYYFPGWKLFVNNKEMPIDYLKQQYKGVITFPLKKGIYNVALRYDYSPISQIAQKISLIVFAFYIALLLIFLFNYLEDKMRKGKRAIT